MNEGLTGESARVEVRSNSHDYPVVVGNGVLTTLPQVLASAAPNQRVAFISDQTVADLHTRTAVELCVKEGVDASLFTFEAGEASKSRKTWSILTDAMLDAGFGRDSCIVAMGGGVTTDLGGFVAATYLRGVPVVQVPTSTLAMIDASVGGKTGVDVRAGKNLVGAFHPPRIVIADTALLGTLGTELRAQGLVEAVKHGAIADVRHLTEIEDRLEELLGGDPGGWADIVTRSVEIKAGVVSRDEFEGGLRQVLNFGHTIGHAIEAASAYSMGHGTAVGLGMLAEAEAGEILGITEAGTQERLASLLSRLLPRGGPRPAIAEALPYLRQDKKARDGRARYILLRQLGEVAEGDRAGRDVWTHEVPAGVVSGVVERALA